ncbi:PqqD family protein [Nonomuraea turcica]|uniref:PqqD family protein n=1 Tax=Nonomuraea sp. G32 TaxID=3067274 RepID=UPI00273CA8B3|nr:PqqD family protein [Nonomuraea sp. G32]MDP4500508.1 PqqD family protein [Nonomuraea sp. G32]
MIDYAARLSIADHVVFRETNGTLCMLFDRDKGVMYELNETASAVVRSLRDDARSFSELIQDLATEYDASPEMIAEDSTALVTDLEQAGLLRIVTS